MTMRAWNFLTAVALFAADRFKQVSTETYTKRLQHCRECVPPHGYRVGGKCTACGCWVQLKARLPKEDCPINKWEKIETDHP